MTVKDINTLEVLRVEPALTDKQVKAILNGGLAHSNSIVELIKDDPILLAKFQENRTKYLANWDAVNAFYSRGIGSTSLTDN